MIKWFVSTLLIAFLVSCAGPKPALDTPDLEGRLISAFTVTGLESTSLGIQKRILSYISSQKGATYSPDRLDQDIRDTYNSGLIDDIQFFVEPDNENVQVTAEVVPGTLMR